MTWQRSDPDEAVLGELADVAHALEAAAAEAPPSPRVAQIRASLLEEVAVSRQPAIALRALVLAAVILLAVMVAFGAPVVGSYIDGLIHHPTPVPVRPDAHDTSRDLRAVRPQLPPVESRSAAPTPSPAPVGAAAAPVAAPPASVAPSVEVAASPSVLPSAVPSPLPSGPTPPIRIPLPTPPIPVPIPSLPPVAVP